MCEEQEREPRLSIGVDMKLNLGNYESLGGSMMLSGIRPGMNADEIGALLETGELTYEILRERLAERMNAEKQTRKVR